MKKCSEGVWSCVLMCTCVGVYMFMQVLKWKCVQRKCINKNIEIYRYKNKEIKIYEQSTLKKRDRRLNEVQYEHFRLKFGSSVRSWACVCNSWAVFLYEPMSAFLVLVVLHKTVLTCRTEAHRGFSSQKKHSVQPGHAFRQCCAQTRADGRS